MNMDEVPPSCSLCSCQIVEATKRYKLKEESKKLLLGLPCKLVGERRFVLTGYICKDCHFSIKRRKSLTDKLQKLDEELYVKINSSEILSAEVTKTLDSVDCQLPCKRPRTDDEIFQIQETSVKVCNLQ